MKRLMPCLAILFSPAFVAAEDVPQFRGPGGLGISKETNLPVTWSATENLRWKAELPGRGLSNPVIADGRVYVTATAAYQQKRQDTQSLDHQLHSLQRENELLKGHVERLQNDPNAIEHQAREELHYTRPGEVIYTLPAEPSKSAGVQGGDKH